MSRNLEILKQADWFLGKDNHQHYPIYYKYVICYSLLSYLNTENYSKEKGIYTLKELQTAIGENKYFKKDKFIELFPLHEDWGFVIVDQSDGIYPLVIYSKKRESDIGEVSGSERVVAFKVSLDKVIEKYEEIYNYLNHKNLTDWNQDFQENLFQSVDFKYADVE